MMVFWIVLGLAGLLLLPFALSPDMGPEPSVPWEDEDE